MHADEIIEHIWELTEQKDEIRYQIYILSMIAGTLADMVSRRDYAAADEVAAESANCIADIQSACEIARQMNDQLQALISEQLVVKRHWEVPAEKIVRGADKSASQLDDCIEWAERVFSQVGAITDAFRARVSESGAFYVRGVQ